MLVGPSSFKEGQTGLDHADGCPQGFPVVGMPPIGLVCAGSSSPKEEPTGLDHAGGCPLGFPVVGVPPIGLAQGEKHRA